MTCRVFSLLITTPLCARFIVYSPLHIGGRVFSDRKIGFLRPPASACPFPLAMAIILLFFLFSCLFAVLFALLNAIAPIFVPFSLSRVAFTLSAHLFF